MDIAEEKPHRDDLIAITGVEEDPEEEVEEEEEEEVEEEEEEVEEEEEEIGEEEREEIEERGTDNIGSAGDEIKHSVVRDSSSGKIFVGGVSWDTTEETFTQHFNKYGQIVDSVIMKDKHTRRPRGFGFVTFADPSAVDKVLEDEHVIKGRMVEVKRTIPREDMQVKGEPKTRKIFVGGIPPSFTEDELKEYFSSYGSIVEHQIMLDHTTGRSRGFGFVTFESEDTVDKIISEDKTHELGGKQVEIKKAEPKRASDDQGSDARARYGGGVSNPYRGFGSGYVGYGSGYRSGGYGGYGEAYGPGPDVYSGYGGYGYGYGYGAGFGGPMFGGTGYGGDGYGSTGGYGGAYSGAGGYGGSRGYGSGGVANRRYHPYGK